MENLVSVIIPIYNHTEHLHEVLESLKKQTYSNFEVIVVDDGSTPPVDPAKFLQGIFFPIDFIRQENKGAPSARNFGFTHSHGEYILFLDADVILAADMVSRLHGALEKNPDASYAYCDHYFGNKRIVSRSFSAHDLKLNNYISTMSLIRRKDFPGFDESLKRFQDWDLWLTLLEHNKVGVYTSGFFFRTYPHVGGMSSWLPSFAYKFPFKYFPLFFGKVRKYQLSKRIVQNKHHI